MEYTPFPSSNIVRVIYNSNSSVINRTYSREAFHAEEPDSFFPYLDTLTSTERFPPPESSSTEDIYRFAIDTALSEGYLAEPGELASLEMSLALHLSLPKLEAAFQYYTNAHGAQLNCGGGAWVEWYDNVVCDAATLKQLVEVELIDPSESSESPSTGYGNIFLARPNIPNTVSDYAVLIHAPNTSHSTTSGLPLPIR